MANSQVQKRRVYATAAAIGLGACLLLPTCEGIMKRMGIMNSTPVATQVVEKECPPPAIQTVAPKCPEGQSCQPIKSAAVASAQPLEDLCGNNKCDHFVFKREEKGPGDKPVVLSVAVDERREYIVDGKTGNKYKNPNYCPDDCKSKVAAKPKPSKDLQPCEESQFASVLKKYGSALNRYTDDQQTTLRSVAGCPRKSSFSVAFRVDFDAESNPHVARATVVCATPRQTTDLTPRMSLQKIRNGPKTCFHNGYLVPVDGEQPTGNVWKPKQH